MKQTNKLPKPINPPMEGWKQFIRNMFPHSCSNPNNFYNDSFLTMDDARNWAEGMRKLVDEKEIVIEQRNTRVWMKFVVIESQGEKIKPSCSCKG
jgi:hypothetical protein